MYPLARHWTELLSSVGYDCDRTDSGLLQYLEHPKLVFLAARTAEVSSAEFENILAS